MPPEMVTGKGYKLSHMSVSDSLWSRGPAAPLLSDTWKQLPSSRHQLPLILPPSSLCSRVTLASSCAGTGDYTISVQRGGNVPMP